jgi:hypothetical protein
MNEDSYMPTRTLEQRFGAARPTELAGVLPANLRPRAGELSREP